MTKAGHEHETSCPLSACPPEIQRIVREEYQNDPSRLAVGQQLMAYVENGLWLDMARSSNRIAARIANGLREVPKARMLAPVEANEIFLELPGAAMDALEADGFQFYRRSKTLARFVCRFDATEAEADALVAALRRYLN